MSKTIRKNHARIKSAEKLVLSYVAAMLLLAIVAAGTNNLRVALVLLIVAGGPLAYFLVRQLASVARRVNKILNAVDASSLRDGRPVKSIKVGREGTDRQGGRNEAPGNKEQKSSKDARPRTPTEDTIDKLEEAIPCANMERIVIEISSFNDSASAKRCALIAVTFADEEGSPVLPEADGPIHAELGRYFYLDDSDTEIATRAEITVPKGAAVAHLSGIQWRKADTTYIREIKYDHVARVNQETQVWQLDRFIDGIPGQAELVVIYTTAPPFGDATLSLRSNRLARIYAEQGCYVIYFPFNTVSDDAVVVEERLIQLSRSSMPALVRRAAQRRRARSTFICSSFADIAALGTSEYLKRAGWRTVYEVRDDMEEFNRVGYSKWFSATIESRVAKRADALVAVSPRLADKAMVISDNPECRLVPNGVPDALADRYAHLRTLEAWQARTDANRVGYIGHLTPSWFDWEMLISLAGRFEDVVFDIVGHEAPVIANLPANIRVHGPLPHDQCAELARTWQAGLIPFRDSTLSRAVDPNKLYEYLAFGLRTLSSPMGSVSEAPSTWVADTLDGWTEALTEILHQPMEAEELIRVEEYVNETRWSRRGETMLELLREIP